MQTKQFAKYDATIRTTAIGHALVLMRTLVHVCMIAGLSCDLRTNQVCHV
jgi:hypothetical protein